MQEKNSHDVNFILTRLKSALKISSDTQLAQELGIGKNVLSNWKSRNTIDYRLLFTICESKNLSLDAIGLGRYPSTDYQNQINEPPVQYLTGKPKGLPLIPISAVAGLVNDFDFTVDFDGCDWYDIPDFTGRADFLIKVYGDSMVPRFSNGDTLACKKITDHQHLQWNRAYVLDTDQGPLVKRVRKSEDQAYLLLESDNKSFEPFEIPRQSVRAMALVVGLIRVL